MFFTFFTYVPFISNIIHASPPNGLRLVALPTYPPTVARLAYLHAFLQPWHSPFREFERSNSDLIGMWKRQVSYQINHYQCVLPHLIIFFVEIMITMATRHISASKCVINNLFSVYSLGQYKAFARFLCYIGTLHKIGLTNMLAFGVRGNRSMPYTVFYKASANGAHNNLWC